MPLRPLPDTGLVSATVPGLTASTTQPKTNNLHITYATN